MSGGLIESWMGIFNVDFASTGHGLFLIWCVQVIREQFKKEDEAETSGKAGEALSRTGQHTCDGSRSFPLGYKCSVSRHKPQVASKSSLGKQKANPCPWLSTRGGVGLVFSFADSCLNECLFKKETYL